MDWEEARAEIQNKVKVRDNLKTIRSSDRFVRAVPPVHFRVQIGSDKKRNFVDITWTMLEKCWRELNKTGKYNCTVFRKYYSKKDWPHGCYVHTVGKIFEKAGLVDSVDDKFYVLKQTHREPVAHQSIS